ncbi:hypothetical protein SNE40_011863 [Patella caerulea]|uniref:F-box domain-containing protein n=1 Tax=Patella caerulea TaxID=87958 RepID=A0AAN8JMS3_PATCE
MEKKVKIKKAGCKPTKVRSKIKAPSPILEPGSLAGSQRHLSSSFSMFPTGEMTSTNLPTEIEDQSLYFQDLPEACKLKVFSYLENVEKGKYSSICKDWAFLMKSPRLWNHVSLSDFTLRCLCTHKCTSECYKKYKSRVFHFIQYLCQIRPVLNSLEFKLDIYNPSDKYLPQIENFLRMSQCRELNYAHLNWKETPNQPLWLEEDCLYRESDVIHRHRLRHRKFVWFFDFFTNIASNLRTLIMPFGWSETSVEHLKRLKNLHTLVLEKYFVFQGLNQALLDRVLGNLPSLKQLLLEVWTPSGAGLLFYTLSSPSLQYLDISQSRGFYLSGLNMPALKRFCVARHPWNGPVVACDKINIPCLYGVLIQGTPHLEKINDHYLDVNWKDGIYVTLEEVFKAVCACKLHKRGWAM